MVDLEEKVFKNNKDLQLQIEKRKKQAERRQFWNKANNIARILGSGGTYRNKSGFNNSKYEYSDSEFEIYYRYTSNEGGGGSHQTVFYKGNCVFRGDMFDTYQYIPGNWERKFNELYKASIKSEKRKRREFKEKEKLKEKNKEEGIRSKWGL